MLKEGKEKDGNSSPFPLEKQIDAAEVDWECEHCTASDA
jgi:hypothetical protein